MMSPGRRGPPDAETGGAETPAPDGASRRIRWVLEDSAHREVLDLSLDIHAALFDNDFEAARLAADLARSIVATSPPSKESVETARAWETFAASMEKRLGSFLLATDLSAQRTALPLLTEMIERYLETFTWTDRPVSRRMHCPMAFGPGEGADWYQRSDGVENPFFGTDHAMEACGSPVVRNDGGGE